MRDVSVEVPDGRINVWHRLAGGNAGTIALVHGLSGTSRWWLRVIDHLPQEVGIVALDVRGRGGSVDSPPPYDLNTIADDIVRALNHFEVDQATVAGYSMGAWVAAIFGTRHADRAERVVLVDGGLPIPHDPGADSDSVIGAVVGPSLARLAMDFADEEGFYEYWKSHPAFEEHWDDSMREPLGYELRPVGGSFKVLANAEAISVSARQITVDPETSAAARDVAVPARLIVVERGTADQEGGMIPLRSAEEAEWANPNLNVVYLRGVNHYTLILGVGAPEVASAIASG
jgi:lipase